MVSNEPKTDQAPLSEPGSQTPESNPFYAVVVWLAGLFAGIRSELHVRVREGRRSLRTENGSCSLPTVRLMENDRSMELQ